MLACLPVRVRACACVHVSSCVCVRRHVQDVAAHNMIEAMPTFLFLKVHEFARVCARILWTCSHLGTSSLARCMRVVIVHMGVRRLGATLVCICELIGSRVQKLETYQIETKFVWHAIFGRDRRVKRWKRWSVSGVRIHVGKSIFTRTRARTLHTHTHHEFTRRYG